MVLTLLVASGVALLVDGAEKPARAGAFPGENGKIAFVRQGATDANAANIFTINPDGSGLTKISTELRFDFEPSWSSNGEKIAFSGLRNGNWDIYTINADGSGLKRITKGLSGDFTPSWSPDGKWIAFVKQRREGGANTVCNSCIYKKKVDGTGLRRLTNTKRFASDPAWSPNGKKIAFSQFARRTGGQIFKMDASDGTNKRDLTNTSRLDESGPNWSPDGTKIAYTTASPDTGNENVRTMNADGTNQKNRTGQAGGWSPAWSPDGREIVFIRNSHLFVMKADGTEGQRVTMTQTFDEEPDWQPLP
jgi:Tol biopolymer transport system component